MKLLARDTDDLQVVSAALQDAIVQVRTMRFDTDARVFELVASRFRHETESAERFLAGLRIDGVLGAKLRGIDKGKPEAYAVLLEMSFEETDAPGGELLLTFAGDGQIKLDVEALELVLADVGAPRRATATPDHDL